MAKLRMRQLCQFGIVDILLLTTVVAVVVVCLGGQNWKSAKARPWIVGAWEEEHSVLWLFPNRQYVWLGRPGSVAAQGADWTLSPDGVAEDTYVLKCGEERFFIRSEWGSGVMDLRREDGTTWFQLTQAWSLEGPVADLQRKALG